MRDEFVKEENFIAAHQVKENLRKLESALATMDQPDDVTTTTHASTPVSGPPKPRSSGLAPVARPRGQSFNTAATSSNSHIAKIHAPDKGGSTRASGSSAASGSDVHQNWQLGDELAELASSLPAAQEAQQERSFAIPRALYDRLYRYQAEGVSWMWNLFKQGKGGILGDEMGLGKTIQICAFLHGLRQQIGATHAIVVMPVSLLDQWTKKPKNGAPIGPSTLCTGARSIASERSEE